MLPIRLALLPLFSALALTVVANVQAQSASAMPAVPASVALDRVVSGAWRSPANTVRDVYRHPKQTLLFFGIQPTWTIVEISPGGGWYTEILAPFAHDQGHYIGILSDPATVPADQRKETESGNSRLEAKLAMHQDVYSRAILRQIDYPAAPVLGPPASADAVLTFRNVHNWVMDGAQAQMFKAFFDVLKPGGVLGVTDHRANPGPATDGQKGYVTEQQVIDYATAAGFVLEEKSEINANPKDTKDWPKGVWTLPPTLQLGNVDKAKYQAIGESDRMTLRFRKPGAGAKK